MDNDQIKKIIESCHLNFLIGSGASRPFLGTLGEIENLLSDLADKEESDEKVIVEASIKRHYYDVAIRGNLKLTRGKSDELIETKKIIAAQNLSRGPSFKLWLMLETPANIIRLPKFIETGIDGVSIGSNDLTMLILGIDRDNNKLAKLFHEANPAVLWAFKKCNCSLVLINKNMNKF